MVAKGEGTGIRDQGLANKDEGIGQKNSTREEVELWRIFLVMW
jgi:hypothetical protein